MPRQNVRPMYAPEGLTDAELRASAVPVSVASLPLPSGAATEATLASIFAAHPYDAMLAIARGQVAGVLYVNKFGRNKDVDTGTEDIIMLGGTWSQPTAARVHGLVSTQAADASAGTGARTVEIQGLDSNWAIVTETVTLNGVTPVNTANSYWIIHRMIVATAGSGGANAGVISAVAAVDATTTAIIEIGYNQTQQGLYQIPAGYSGYMTHCNVRGQLSGSVDVELRAKTYGGTWAIKKDFPLSTNSPEADFYWKPYIKFTEKTLIKGIAIAGSGVNNNDISISFDIILVPN